MNDAALARKGFELADDSFRTALRGDGVTFTICNVIAPDENPDTSDVCAYKGVEHGHSENYLRRSDR